MAEYTRKQLDFIESHYRHPEWPARRIAQAMPTMGPPHSEEAVRKKAQYLGVSGSTPGLKRYGDKVKTCLMMAAQDEPLATISERIDVSIDWARKTINASPYHARRYKERETLRRSHGQRLRHAKGAA